MSANLNLYNALRARTNTPAIHENPDSFSMWDQKKKKERRKKKKRYNAPDPITGIILK